MAVLLSFLLEVVLFSFQCLVYKYCMKIFRGDMARHVTTKPRQLGRHLGSTKKTAQKRRVDSAAADVFFPNSELR